MRKNLVYERNTANTFYHCFLQCWRSRLFFHCVYLEIWAAKKIQISRTKRKEDRLFTCKPWLPIKSRLEEHEWESRKTEFTWKSGLLKRSRLAEHEWESRQTVSTWKSGLPTRSRLAEHEWESRQTVFTWKSGLPTRYTLDEQGWENRPTVFT